MKKTRKTLEISKQKCFSINKKFNKQNKSKTQGKPKMFFQASTRMKIQDYILVTMSKSKKLAKFKERLSIIENQSQASFKVINRSNMGIGSSPHAFKTNLGGKRQNESLHQKLQESS
jgi:hypothetical protein